jgi:hypothetical protein
MDNKEFVLRYLLEQVGALVPLQKAVVATLGGEGREARLWMELDIPASHGWLIERSPKRSRRLLNERVPYEQLQGSLHRFPDLLRAQHGKKAAIDYFHWDLCGTIEPNIKELTLVLPFLEQGRGRLLGITVADMRRNLSLESASEMKTVGSLLFQDAWEAVWEHLMDLHRQERTFRSDSESNPENASIRELGCFVYLLFALTKSPVQAIDHFRAFLEGQIGPSALLDYLRSQDVFLTIKPLVRIMYHSSASGFRMRTYLFRLQDRKTGCSFFEAARELAEHIQRCAYHLVEQAQLIRVNSANLIAPRNPSPGDSTMTVQTVRARLTPFLGILNAELQQDLEAIFRQAESAEADASELKSLRAKLDALRSLLSDTPARPATDSATAGGNSPPAPNEKPRRRRGRPRKHPQSHTPAAHEQALSEEMKDDIRLKLLRARRASGDEGFEKERVKILRSQPFTRLGDERRARNILRGIWAQSQGKHRTAFLKRLLPRINEDQRAEFVNEMAEMYEMTVKALNAEIR